ncbi:DUF6452 family protein [Flavobacterium ardleyense]|uniref:DUF6452 family protein n=1 Tax=Flavobacterium ardleyense TaxID=2038737 RepID=A0ABW5Z9U7_9FLAO
MRKFSSIVLVLLLAVSFWNCEKDDICAEGDANTPFIVIEFYDSANPTVLKNVTNLKVLVNGTTTAVVFNKDLASDNAERYLSNAKKITIPLNSNATQSGFEFKFNFGDPSENTDAITFKYESFDVYLSRACGYKKVFELDPTEPFVFVPSGTSWIQNIEVTQPNITNENEVHVKIYF